MERYGNACGADAVPDVGLDIKIMLILGVIHLRVKKLEFSLRWQWETCLFFLPFAILERCSTMSLWEVSLSDVH